MRGAIVRDDVVENVVEYLEGWSPETGELVPLADGELVGPGFTRTPLGWSAPLSDPTAAPDRVTALEGRLDTQQRLIDALLLGGLDDTDGDLDDVLLGDLPDDGGSLGDLDLGELPDDGGSLGDLGDLGTLPDSGDTLESLGSK